VITLTTATNDFTGAVSLNNSGANNVSVTDANAIVLGASAVGTGTLGVTAGGAITETGAITQAAAAGAVTLSVTAAGSDVLSEHAGEQLQWCGRVRRHGCQRARRGPAQHERGRDRAGARDAHQPAQPDVAVRQTPRCAARVHDDCGGGNATVTAGGAITQGGAAVVTGTSSFTTGAFAVTLTNAANNFTGAVSLTNTGANTVQITDVNAIQLGTVNIGQNLTVNAVGITQNAGGLTVPGPRRSMAGLG